MISTQSGNVVNPLNVRTRDIDIEDMAHGLALINRFYGQTKKPISVAQHSVYVSRLCERVSRKIALQGLLHDGSEYILGDINKWLKNSVIFDAYRTLEEQVQSTIFRKFGVPQVQHEAVSEADQLMVRFEGEQGYNYNIFQPPAVPDDRVRLYGPLTKHDRQRIGPWKPWSWAIARASFLDQYRLLTDNGDGL